MVELVNWSGFIPMLTKIKFKTNGDLKLDKHVTFQHEKRKYDLEVDVDGYLISIAVTFRLPPNLTPTIEATPDVGVKAHITIPTSIETDEILDNLRTAEGLLSFYGLKEIKLISPHQEWIPETPEEKESLQIPSFSLGSANSRSKDDDPLPVDLVIRNIIAAASAKNYQVALSFYRKGCLDMDERRYIDAFYDFFFVLEHLYGNGQFKSKQVKENFCSSAELMKAVVDEKQSFHLIVPFNSPAEQKKCLDHYTNNSAEDILGMIVDLRGELHHHSSKKKDAWHPEDHSQYRVPTMFCQRVAFKVCFALTKTAVFSDQADSSMSTVTDCKIAPIK